MHLNLDGPGGIDGSMRFATIRRRPKDHPDLPDRRHHLRGLQKGRQFGGNEAGFGQAADALVSESGVGLRGFKNARWFTVLHNFQEKSLANTRAKHGIGF